MSHAVDHAPRDERSKCGPLGRWRFRRRPRDPIVCAVKRDRGALDFWALRQLHLDRLKAFLARSVPDPVPVRMDDDIDEIGIVEGNGSAVIGVVGEVPVGGPSLPKEAAKRPPVGLQARPSTFSIEVVLIPDPLLGFWGSRRGGSDSVLYCVAADQNCRAHSIRMKRRRDRRRPSSPVESGNREPGEPQSIRKVDHILADGGLLRHVGSGRIAKTRGPVPAQIGDQHAISRLRQRWRDFVEGANVVRETVQQDDGESLGWTALFVRDVQDRRLDRPGRSLLSLRQNLAALNQTTGQGSTGCS